MRARRVSIGWAKETRITERKGLCDSAEPCRWCNGRATTSRGQCQISQISEDLEKEKQSPWSALSMCVPASILHFS